VANIVYKLLRRLTMEAQVYLLDLLQVQAERTRQDGIAIGSLNWRHGTLIVQEMSAARPLRRAM